MCKYSVDNLIVSMVKGCDSQEKSSQWISAKQVKFLCDVAQQDAQARYTRDFVAERRGSNRRHIDTNKYNITVTISPINGAATAWVTNRVIGVDNFNKELDSERQQAIQTIEYNQRMLEKAIKYDDTETAESIKKEIEQLKNKHRL